MRILFLLHNVSKTRHFDGVLELLAEKGHSIVLAVARQRNRPAWLPKNLVQVNDRLQSRRMPGRIEMIPCPSRRVDGWQDVAQNLRQARDYVRFFDPRYSNAQKLTERAALNTPDGLRALLDRPFARRHWRGVARLLATAEAVVPSDKLFELFIRYERPDVVLITPLVDYGSYQPDYVKSAQRLGVPVVFLPFSWDNLTNRGLIRVEPDLLLVWNEFQKKEAVEMHGIAADRVKVIGAPRFDEFFVMRPSTSREEFCSHVRLAPDRPFILYVCSSPFVAPREVEFVERWNSELRRADDPLIRTCGVLVRPHPVHAKQWRGVDCSGLAQTALWSGKETLNADQGLYDSLHHASAVVGLNTSAMIEAAIAGKPVHSILAEEFSGGQEQTLHFQYLRGQNGGVLIEGRSIEEHIQQLASTLRTNGVDCHRRQEFLERFVRPRGMNVPVAPGMVDEIERAALIVKRPRRWTPAWHHAARIGLRGAFSGRDVIVRKHAPRRSHA
ncbi:MAG TPA: hypothetical protein VIK60_01520 [Vicinamibacterales bacterium]